MSRTRGVSVSSSGAAVVTAQLHIHCTIRFLLSDLSTFSAYDVLAIALFVSVILQSALRSACAFISIYLLGAVMVDVDDGSIEAVAHLERPVGTHKCLYANIRGLSQGAGELAAMVEKEAPHFVFLTECHIHPKESIDIWIPHGYKVVVKRCRSKHGGGLIILSQEHLLCDTVSMKKYHIDEAAELVAMRYGEVVYVDGYSNKSSVCGKMIAALGQMRIDMPTTKFVVMGDFNIHNEKWLHSVSGTDDAGEKMEEFVQLNGIHQLVDFPTCGDNTLDLIMTDWEGSATESAHLGTSDHVSILFEIHVEHRIPEVALQAASLNWRKAPWNHIRFHVGVAVKDWSPAQSQSPSEAEEEFDSILWKVVEKHVKLRAPTKQRPHPW